MTDNVVKGVEEAVILTGHVHHVKMDSMGMHVSLNVVLDVRLGHVGRLMAGVGVRQGTTKNRVCIVFHVLQTA